MVEVHGHRGARALFPENTIAGFLYAIGVGCDAIEFDVLATRDDVLVACHDPVLRTGAVRELTLEELRLPTVREVFDLAARGDFIFDVEIKCFPRRPHLTPPPGRIAEMLIAEIERARVAPRVTVLSFDFRVLRALRQITPEIRTAALYKFGGRDFVSIAGEAETGMVAPYHRLVTPGKVEAAHCAGIRILPWTANRPRDWKRLIRAAVDGIITDDPAALLEFRGEATQPPNSAPETRPRRPRV